MPTLNPPNVSMNVGVLQSWRIGYLVNRKNHESKSMLWNIVSTATLFKHCRYIQYSAKVYACVYFTNSLPVTLVMGPSLPDMATDMIIGKRNGVQCT